MNQKIDMQFVRKVVKYYNDNESTTRETGEHFGIGNATVHRYLTKVYPNERSAEILAKHKKESLYLAKEAFKNKYSKKR